VGDKVVGNINKLDSAGLQKILKALGSDTATSRVQPVKKDSVKNNFNLFNSNKKSYSSRKEYDSLQQVLPKDKRDSWLKQAVKRKGLELKEKYKENSGLLVARMWEKFLHQLPMLLFVSLPFFALFLKMLYAGKKNVYYVNHAIFGIHYYIFCFVGLLLYFVIMKLGVMWNWVGWESIKLLLSIAFFFYLYKALRNFYEQRRAKTLLKFLLLCFLTVVLMLLLFGLFIVFSIFNI
jgi:hypothetical protein